MIGKYAGVVSYVRVATENHLLEYVRFCQTIE